MISTGAYDYINVLTKAADASYRRGEILSNNMANVDTPGFKRQDLDFATELRRALGGGTNAGNMDQRVKNIRTKALRGREYTDMIGFSYRLDGNNVDPDTEQVMIVENQDTYDGLLYAIDEEFKNLKMVMK